MANIEPKHTDLHALQYTQMPRSECLSTGPTSTENSYTLKSPTDTQTNLILLTTQCPYPQYIQSVQSMLRKIEKSRVKVPTSKTTYLLQSTRNGQFFVALHLLASIFVRFKLDSHSRRSRDLCIYIIG